jgi:hypothetical protein
MGWNDPSPIGRFVHVADAERTVRAPERLV